MSAAPRSSVLIVEDERIFAMDLQETLNELGYDAFAVASSSEEALARAAERRPDLVLMDIRIKGTLDGVDAAALLKAKFGVAVVFLTAHSDDATIARAKMTEPEGYLLKPVRDAELRSVVEVMLHKHDIEQRLRRRERWFSTTLRSIADAVIAVDPAGNVTFMNPAAEALTGKEHASSIGAPIADVFQLVDEPEGHESPVLAALRSRRPVELPEGMLLDRRTGALRVVSDSAAPVVDGDQTLGAVMVFRDVTERRKAERQAELADRLASLGMLAAGVAHEVNNPLAVIAGNSGALIQEIERLRQNASEPDEQARVGKMLDSLRDLQVAASRIRDIVSDLRAFSRPRESRTRAVALNACIEWAIQATRHELRSRAKLVSNLGDVPLVRGDETRIGQVLVNLLVNAAQAISPGKADRNEVTVISTTAPNGNAVVEVRDTGAGIPEHVLGQVFEAFFTTKRFEGTGLGLSICRGIVESLGGTIRVESVVGSGTSVIVELPPSSEAKAASTRAASAKAERLRGRVLVVDDEKLLLNTMRLVLSEHDTTCVDSAVAALALIADGAEFDVILSDVTMPTMSGMEFYENLLGSRPDLARRMIFLTGGAITVEAENFLHSIANPRLDKPFEIPELLDTVQQVLKQ